MKTYQKFSTFLTVTAMMALEAGPAFADIVPLPIAPLPGGGLLGLAIVGVAGGIWLARRKR